MKKKGLAMVLSMVLSASLFVGCGSTATESKSTKSDSGKQVSAEKNQYEAADMSKLPQAAKDRKDTLIIGTTAPKGVFNPLFATSSYDTNIARTMYERLLVADEKGQPIPRLAESYNVSEDGMTITYKIRKDANWSDGTPVTSKDVELGWKILADASYDGQQDVINGSYTIAGIKDYHDGKAENISGIKLLDDKTIEFHLDNYYPFAAQDIASIEIIPSSWYGPLYKHGDCSGLKSTYTEPGPVSGAYKLTKYEKGQEVDMEANNSFYLGAPKIKKLIWKVDTTDNVLQLLKAGEIDMDVVTSNNDNIDEIESAGFLGYKHYPSNSYSYIALNQALPQFKDVEVRKALTIGIDRKKIVEAAYDKYAKVINIPESSVAWTYKEPKETYDYDVEKAKKILEDAGWKVGSNGIREKNGVKLSCHFVCPTGNDFYSTLLSVLDHDWKELGVDYTGEQIDFNALITKTDNKDFDAYCMAWSLNPIPGGETLFPTGASQNYNSYSNANIDKLSKDIAAEHDKDKIKELYGQYYDELNVTLPYTCLAQGIATYVISGRVKGIEPSSYVPFYSSLYKATIE
jgi:peptide/nickel transport system substrate-binding protein